MGAYYWVAESTTHRTSFQNPDPNFPPSDPRTLTLTAPYKKAGLVGNIAVHEVSPISYGLSLLVVL